MRPRVVVGISGASGAALGVRVVELLAGSGQSEVHLVVTPGGERTLGLEVGRDAQSRLSSLVVQRHAIDDVGASVASGSFRTLGMIVAPCSMRSLSSIAAGTGDNLLVRAAGVHLKERRRLILAVRESPLHLGHLRAMTTVSEYGAVVAPIAPTFYLGPKTIAEMIDQMAHRLVDLLGLTLDGRKEWLGTNGSSWVLGHMTATQTATTNANKSEQ
ncbi:MAG: UbiX family flavin prenyltransferase [Bauldia sp.]|nr:UbiX family flavin prenyltransferase [Bauldia sp.]